MANLFLLLLATAWFGSDPSWEPAIVAVGFLLNQLRLERNLRHPSFVDADLFNEFISILPSNGVARFLSEHDFGNGFHFETLEPLRQFNADWRNAEHEFADSKLDAHRTKLLEIADEFLPFLAQHTTPDAQSWQKLHSELRETNPGFYDDIRNRLNELGDHFFQTHQKLIRAAKKLQAP